MKKILLLSAVALMSLAARPTFAAPVDDGQQVQQQDQDQMAIPAGESQDEMQYDDQMTNDMSDLVAPWPGGHHQRHVWQCQARDFFRRGYTAQAWDRNRAAYMALHQCQRRAPLGRCRLAGCWMIH